MAGGQSTNHQSPTTDHPFQPFQPDLFADFNGLPDREARLEFYHHDQNWSNRMILGDSLQVMASLAEREGLRGQVQCIYLDPPYGINFRSNWQVSTLSRDVKDGDRHHISREPEQIRAFRDTWQDGINSYLTYLRDRLTIARDLLHDSGSTFVQIGDENVHRVRAAMDEVFGAGNFCGLISVLKTTSQSGGKIPGVADFILWYAKNSEAAKVRPVYTKRTPVENPTERYICIETGINCLVDLTVDQKSGRKPIPQGRYVKLADPTSQTGGASSRFVFHHWGRNFQPSGARGWSTNPVGMTRVQKADYFYPIGKNLCGSSTVIGSRTRL